MTAKPVIDLTEDEFHARFPLVPNHINPAAGWTVGDSPGCLFETYGDEVEFVRRADPRTVWTLVEADGDLSLLSGFRYVNRIGYLISRVPVAAGESILVSLESPSGEDGSW